MGSSCALTSSGRSRSSPTLATALQRMRHSRRRATYYVRRGGVGYFFGAYDVHRDVLFGGYRLAKTTTEVLAINKYIRRRYPDDLESYRVSLPTLARVRVERLRLRQPLGSGGGVPSVRDPHSTDVSPWFSLRKTAPSGAIK